MILKQVVVEPCVQRKGESPEVFTKVLSVAADAAQNGITLSYCTNMNHQS